MKFLQNIFGKKDDPINNYEDFWGWFVKNERRFANVVKEQGNIEKDFFDDVTPKLDQLRQGIFTLTGMFDDNTVELVLTPDGVIENIVFVEEIVSAAPQITGWKFTALKPAMDRESFSVSMAGYNFSTDNIKFYPNKDNIYPDEIDITFSHEDLNDSNKAEIGRGCLIFLDNFLGELNFLTQIDNLTFVKESEAKHPMKSVSELKEFLKLRQAEFVEKYDGTRINTEDDAFSVMEAELPDGGVLIATINTELLNWDRKASHPWIMSFQVRFHSSVDNGMPDEDTYELLNQIDDDLQLELKDVDGFLSIGRETSNGLRAMYFACNDFRKPSKVADSIKRRYSKKLECSFEIYKDKYWRTFHHFMANPESEIVS
jgi:Family of unknown function (DUF695)